jgi:hypothetical protein
MLKVNFKEMPFKKTYLTLIFVFRNWELRIVNSTLGNSKKNYNCLIGEDLLELLEMKDVPLN